MSQPITDGPAFQRMREAKGLTRMQLGQELGESLGTIKRWEWEGKVPMRAWDAVAARKVWASGQPE